ncbi:hypothetical protein [Lactobacillus jensenii]|uniref:Uncharacterized protein n=1 Tax=Lactobacillus jensenii TaxID=109790 RepID=A0ABU9FJ22_LACJE|nr:hypothetical protein [Lactobacillus jensenii]DAR66714.1 MAG TPA: hypothetical protein [Caudoviricetes sp.]MCW8072180.1 hypothetical protein [Lactobacillus jensenii]MCW8089592.1 hypothetical protein [Lactobacillus jensenii]MDK8236074.1 hypothetical protein [Lactobacillus jensenii]MDT9544362.1 hypothetical protein [Lactobacillus jensenii]
MEFKPNKELINDFVRTNYKPQTISWNGDYHLDLTFDDNKQADIVFDKYDLEAASFPVSQQYKYSEEIIKDLNIFKSQVGKLYIQFDTYNDLEKSYQYFKFVMESNDNNFLEKFLQVFSSHLEIMFPTWDKSIAMVVDYWDIHIHDQHIDYTNVYLNDNNYYGIVCYPDRVELRYNANAYEDMNDVELTYSWEYLNKLGIPNLFRSDSDEA